MGNKICKVEGCTNKHYAKGYCNKHYQQIKKHGEIQDEVKFDIDFLKNEFKKRNCKLITKEYVNTQQHLYYICNNHKEEGIQKTFWGNFKNHDCCPLCKKEKGVEYIIDRDVVIMKITKNKNQGEVLFNLSHLEKVKKHNWYINEQGYCVGDSKIILLHRFLTNCPDDKVVDHIDGNPLNNLDSNLRFCNHLQNTWNCRLNKNNTSNVRGVHWDKNSNKWMARISVNKRRLMIGLFDDIEEAKQSRIKAELKYYGEYNSIDRWKNVK